MRQLLDSADCVLLDFDGPVCRLFIRHPAPAAAARLRALLDDHGTAVTPTDPDDPAAVLRAAVEQTGNGVVRSLAEALGTEELGAAESAWPTPYADQLIQTLHATGRRLGIATDCTAGAVERYLRSRGLAHLFAGTIHGRDAAEPRPKPDPDCVRRALAATGVSADRTVYLGSTDRELAAATAAGVRFLGYGRNEKTAAALRSAGAEHVVTSLLDVVDAVNVPNFR